MPGFLERDEGEREPPCDRFPWDGISGVRPYRGFAATTTVGVDFRRKGSHEEHEITKTRSFFRVFVSFVVCI